MQPSSAKIVYRLTSHNESHVANKEQEKGKIFVSEDKRHLDTIPG